MTPPREDQERTSDRCPTTPAGSPIGEGSALPERSAERVQPDADLLALLGSIDNALRNGSNMTNANLAFELLCEQMSVDRDALSYSNAEVHKVAAKRWGEVSFRG